jgi:hypothetical protein
MKIKQKYTGTEQKYNKELSSLTGVAININSATPTDEDKFYKECYSLGKDPLSSFSMRKKSKEQKTEGIVNE